MDGTDTVACMGAWNLGNVTVDVINLTTGISLGAFNEATGAYPAMQAGDGFVSKIYNTAPTPVLTGKLYGKNWFVGEPTGIKAVNGDTAVKNGKPQNCLINTSYLDTGYLNVIAPATPNPVICSSPFQSHKRFKVAMQPSTVDSTGGPIDLVFNAADNSTITPYQVFSKINNYTGKRLAGYKIEVGVGTGSSFQTASQLGISDQLYLSLGKYEDIEGLTLPATGTDLFTADGLATFSHGLFGPKDDPMPTDPAKVHFATDGFFSKTVAYYPVEQACSPSTNATPTTCGVQVQPDGTNNVPASDTIYSSGTLTTNYTHLFGEWLPSDWAPKGIFHDDDHDPTTDAKLVAWWNGSEWLMPETDSTGAQVYDASGYAVFVPVSLAQLAAWETDPYYSEDVIEDVLNLGINYIVHVGDFSAATGNPEPGTFTIRIIPVVANDQTAPAWVGTTPIWSTSTSSSGGGCTVGGDGRFDPTLPALLLAALGFVGWRRFSRKS